MPEASDMRGRLARLASELAADREAILRLGRDTAACAGSVTPATTDPAALALLAVDIHRWYTGLESALERIERTFGSLPSGGDWHLELLAGASLDIAGVRPPILPAKLNPSLREVLRFRHFFRHAYAVELDARKLLGVASHVVGAHGAVDAALADFAEFVSRAAAALDAP
jgi:hypothetical protein